MFSRRPRLPLIVLTLASALMLGGLGSAAGATGSDDTSDSDLAASIERRLERKQLGTVEVSVVNGVARLGGAVDTLRLKEKAGKIAAGVGGVAAVENATRIAFGGRVTEDIAADIALALRDPHFNTIFDWVQADIDGRTVVLTGWVTMPWKIEAAQRRMERIRGVQAVLAKIEVLPVSIYDDQIRVAAARRVYRDLRFVDYGTWLSPPIHFVVRHGELILLGEVRNRAEKMLVHSLVGTAGLPLGVVNRLDDGSGTT